MPGTRPGHPGPRTARKPRPAPSWWVPSPQALDAAHALVVEVSQPTPGVICLLHLGIHRPVVPGPELLAGVERRRVQALVPAELGDLVLNPPVEVAVARGRRQRDHAPEAEVHVHLSGPHWVERPALVPA